MESPELPFKDAGSDRLEHTSNAFHDIREQPTFLIGIGVMFSALFVFIMSSDATEIPSKLALLPYLLVLLSGILVSGAYIATLKPPAPQTFDPTPIKPDAPINHAVWPQEKTVQSLSVKLLELSHSHRRMLRIIRDTEGILAYQLADHLGFPREEVVYRCGELEQAQLIQVTCLKDFVYSLPEDHEMLFHRKTTQDILNLS